MFNRGCFTFRLFSLWKFKNIYKKSNCAEFTGVWVETVA